MPLAQDWVKMKVLYFILRIMDYLDPTAKDLNAQEPSNYMERGRYALLNFGYDFIVFKSKARKSLVRLKKRFTTSHL